MLRDIEFTRMTQTDRCHGPVVFTITPSRDILTLSFLRTFENDYFPFISNKDDTKFILSAQNNNFNPSFGLFLLDYFL